MLAFRHSNVQPTTLSLSFWTSSCLFTASPPLQRPTCHSMPLPFGLPRAFPPLQRPIRPPCRTLLDFILPIYCLPTASTSNPPLYAAPFWTSSCLLTTLTSNPTLSRSPFGLPSAYLLASHHFNVQPATLLPLPFGLPPAFPPLQRPIRPPCRTLLDFILPIYCLPTASTSNPPLYAAPFWSSSCLFTAFPPLQRPIRHTLALLLDFILPSHHSNVQFATLHLGVRTSSQKTLDFQTQIYT